MILTEQKATKLRDTIDAGLCAGVGNPIAGECCIVAAKRLAFGLSHGDSIDGPPIGKALRALDIPLNDCPWTSNAARAKGMRRLALAEMGSDQIDQAQFSRLLALRVTQKLLPAALRDYSQDCYEKYHQPLKDIADSCESAKTDEDVTASLASLERLDKDKFFTSIADIAVEVLQEMNCPGCELLYLCDGEKVNR